MSEIVIPQGFSDGAKLRHINRAAAAQYATGDCQKSHFPRPAELKCGKAGRNPGLMNPFQQSRALDIPVPEIKHEIIPA
ncbi:PhzA/PhzB family protein [Streptomyces sp. AV19]|uniref:PhzA/PhzB family protein n=1 Tax=Streptomyces sp. AV19 TaxID=2793068 RepID=UPI0018FEA969|nr:PhzA/PhzB family protein [Streptomyces sp. AV19]MBH1938526.1 PhzA/PhzB family protein [Streptomyces sp. AV19]MDG4535175.1 phenazine biosynthesis protein [Streptomyces sp. AV19]